MHTLLLSSLGNDSSGIVVELIAELLLLIK